MDSRNEYYKNFSAENILNTNFTKQVGRSLKSRRINSGLNVTQQNMAEIIGCTRTHISAIENGHCNVSLNEFLIYSLVLKCPMEELFPVSYEKIEKRYTDTLPKEELSEVHGELPKAFGE